MNFFMMKRCSLWTEKSETTASTYFGLVIYLCANLEVNSDGVFYLSAVLFSAAFPLFQNVFIPPGFYIYMHV